MVARPVVTNRASEQVGREPGSHRRPKRMRLDPASDALLQEMGVRERKLLAGVPYDLIHSWQQALHHRGLAARFTSPIGFAVAQMQQGNSPPALAELERWAECAHRKDDCYGTWRHIAALPLAEATLSYEQQLEQRVRRIAPSGADLDVLCRLACSIEAGATDVEALAALEAQHTGAAP